MNELDWTKDYKKITEERVKKSEGLKLKMYKCPAGKNTIGYGHNLDDVPISLEAAIIIFKNDLEDCEEVLKSRFSIMQTSYTDMPGKVKSVLLDMTFNLGIAGLFKFKNMINYICEKQYKKAAMEGRNSLWYKQVKSRAEYLMNLLENT